MSGHTKGPWEFRPLTGEDSRGMGYIHGGPVDACIAHTGDSSLWTSENEANARLIAAAPEMLEALQAIANGEGVYGAQAHEYKQIARAAISKATGGGL